MSDWRANGIEECSKCKELFTWNHYYFPMMYEGLYVCRGCLKWEEKVKCDPWGNEMEEL